MSIATIYDLGNQILEALGNTDPNVRGFELRCYVEEVVTIKIESVVMIPQEVSTLTDIFKKHELGPAIKVETFPIIPRDHK